MNNNQSLSPQEFQEKYAAKGGEILDVRTPGEYASGHLKNAENLDWMNGEFTDNIDKLDKNKTYYLYCASGNRSGQATNKLITHGFENVYNIGGFANLKAAGVAVK